MRLMFVRFSMLLLLVPMAAIAQGSGAPAVAPLNITLLFMVGVAVVLVFGNMVLANVIRQLAEAIREKNRQAKIAKATPAKAGTLLLVLLLVAGNTWAQEPAVAIASPSFWTDTTPINGIPRMQFMMLLALIILGFVLLISQAFIIRSLIREMRGIPVKIYSRKAFVLRKTLDLFNKSVAVDKEDTILLDHDYDGIRELDNDLPPWWKYGFVLTILVSVVYLGYYHAWGGPSQAQEYLMAMEQAEEEKAAYLATSGEKIDESNVTMILDPGQLADAKVLFNNTCAACHRADGGGAVGPNLTDDYWIHGGSLQNVFKSIKYGWADKGMPPWKSNLSAKQIAMVSSYVKTLKNTKPVGAKAPQGDLFVEGGDKAIDSVSNKTEPSLTPTGTTENKNNPIGPYINKANGQGEGTPPGKVK